MYICIHTEAAESLQIKANNNGVCYNTICMVASLKSYVRSYLVLLVEKVLSWELWLL